MPLFLLFPPPFCQRVFWNACDCYLQRSKTHESIEQLEAEIREALRKRDLQAVGLSPCPHRHPPLAPVKKEALGPVLPKVFSSSSFFVPPLLSLSLIVVVVKLTSMVCIIRETLPLKQRRKLPQKWTTFRLCQTAKTLQTNSAKRAFSPVAKTRCHLFPHLRCHRWSCYWILLTFFRGEYRG